MDMAEKKTVSDRLTESLEIPRAALGNCARIELAGNRELTVEGCVGITEYGEDEVSLSLGALTMKVRGSGLLIRSFDLHCINVSGLIESVEFY